MLSKLLLVVVEQCNCYGVTVHDLVDGGDSVLSVTW